MSPHHSGRIAPPRRNRENPSFSAALLDAIYHSLDADGSVPASSPAEGSPVTGRRRPSQGNLSPSVSSVRSPRLQKTPRPCRVQPDPQPSLLLPPPPQSTGDGAEKKRSRKKNKRGTKSAPFACLLNALLCNRRSAKSAEPTTPRALAMAPPVVTVEPASARSILSSRASRRQSAVTGGILTPARRAVRFSPVTVVVDDDKQGYQEAGVARLRGAEMEVAAAQESAAEAERRVEELLRALGVAEENEKAKESSKSSSDLFELDSLPAFDDAELQPRPRATTGLVQSYTCLDADECLEMALQIQHAFPSLGGAAGISISTEQEVEG